MQSLILISLIITNIVNGGTEIRSPTTKYTLCKRLSKGGNGMVHTAAISALSDPNPGVCGPVEKVIIKCGDTSLTAMYESEYASMLLVENQEWAPRVFEFFKRTDTVGGSCITMERLGSDLEKIRLGYPENATWPWVTLGSIGSRMIEIVKTMHLDLGLTHTDLHLGNFAVGLSPVGTLSSSLYVIDFGDTHELGGPPVGMAHLGYPPAGSKGVQALLEIRQIVISIRYLWDGNFKFYVDKRYTYNESEVCAGIAQPLADAIKYVYGLQEDEEIDYDLVLLYMNQLVGDVSSELVWEPLIGSLGLPTLAPDRVVAPTGDDGKPLDDSYAEPTNAFLQDSQNLETSTSTTTKATVTGIVLNSMFLLGLCAL